MTVIPGKYLDSNGREFTVVGLARHGTDGGGMVVYRDGDGRLLVLRDGEWDEQGFTYAGELEYRDYLAGESRTELVRRIFELFASRGGVYTLHWRSAVGAEGYNYACENHSLVSGCYRGTDSCKNCNRGSLTVFSPEAVELHLRGRQSVGIFPVTPEGLCRFLVMEPDTRPQAEVLRQVCDGLELPCSLELRGKAARLWIFFAEPLPLPHLRRLGCGIVTRAMELSPEIGFDMYDKFIPCRDEIIPGDMGFHLRLPFGGADRSAFADRDGEPLPQGPAEIFRVRTVTRGYLADRLRAVGDPGPGRLWPQSGIGEMPEPPRQLEVTFDGTLAVKKEGLSHRAALALRRMACVKNVGQPYGQFETPTPSVLCGFTEDSQVLRLPRGLRADLRYLARASRTELKVTDGLPPRERVFFTLLRPVGEEQRRAAEQLAQEPEGILMANQGWGKTGAVARLLELKGVRTLILTADEGTRLRWVGNVLEYLGVDTERSGAKVHVRTVTDRRIKDRYDMVILADCSRLPMDGEIFARIRGLTPRYVYGITAVDTRRDGRWDMLRFLCGGVLRC